MRYDEYLQSDEWKARRSQARQRAKNRCEHCGGLPDHVHHVRYPKNFKKVFGPLASVTVTDNAGDVLLDSRRYE